MNRTLPLGRIAVRGSVFRSQQVYMSTNVFKQISKVFTNMLPKRTTIGNARSLLFNCKNQAENSHWHTRGLVGTDFRSKQILLMIHVWIMHKRLITEGKDGLLVQEALFDELWEDTSNRIRGQGVNELSVNKYLKEVQGYSFRICVELDHVLSMLKKPMKPSTLKAQYGEVTSAIKDKASTSGATQTLTTKAADDMVSATAEEADLTPEQVEAVIVDEIGGVLWRLVYLKREDLSEEHVLEFAKYVRNEQRTLMGLSKEAIFESRVQWGPLPDWKALTQKRGADKSSTKLHLKPDRNTTPSGEYKGEWKEATAPDGKTYYWNTLTRETTWEKPKGYKSPTEVEEPTV